MKKTLFRFYQDSIERDPKPQFVLLFPSLDIIILMLNFIYSQRRPNCLWQFKKNKTAEIVL